MNTSNAHTDQASAASERASQLKSTTGPQGAVAPVDRQFPAEPDHLVDLPLLGQDTGRQHIWSSIRINGETLEYTGTGGELFRGALVVFLALILPTVVLFTVLTAVLGPQHPVLGAAQLFVLLLFLLLTGMAVYRARRYRLSRTYWRGIRGTLVGSSWKYSLVYFGSLILRGLTLGWSTPAMNLELQQRITREMRFGETAFSFRGRAGPLYPTYALCWFGLLGAIVLVLAITGYGAGDLGGFLATLTSPEAGNGPAMSCRGINGTWRSWRAS